MLVLNGCGGYEADAGITTTITRRLAELGVVALRLDYLAAKPAPAFTYCDAVVTAAAAPDLLRALAAVTASLRTDPTVDPARIGAVGYSLGGLAVGFAQIGGGPSARSTARGSVPSACCRPSSPARSPTRPASASCRPS